MTTSKEPDNQGDGPQQPQRYAHIYYSTLNPSGRYRGAFAWVGTLEQIAEQHVTSGALPYQHELFGGQDIVTLEGGQLSIVSGDNLFEVFDLE